MSTSSTNNAPQIWQKRLPRPAPDGHKYHRGYAAIFGAPLLTGATRLAATACSRIGAGLVTVVASENADIYRTCLPADIMVHDELPPKASVALSGSGGVAPAHSRSLLNNRELKARVFDADALPERGDFQHLDDSCILTPHHGEFERVFGAIDNDTENAARKAAVASGAIVVLKSSTTVIANPRGETVINRHASPYLAKAGTGDVLAGMITGLVAQGMQPFDACCVAVWMHGESGIRLGVGLIASDIPDTIPEILRELLAHPNER